MIFRLFMAFLFVCMAWSLCSGIGWSVYSVAIGDHFSRHPPNFVPSMVVTITLHCNTADAFGWMTLTLLSERDQDSVVIKMIHLHYVSPQFGMSERHPILPALADYESPLELSAQRSPSASLQSLV
jgi:hypothetical protein